MSSRSDLLDHILGFQISVAWAGEAMSDPPRLGWWQTDLVDELGGGDFFRRLAPKTWRWARFETVREVAARAEADVRKKLAGADDIRSLFHPGFDLDEALAQRLTDHRREGRDPKKVLTTLAVTDEFDRTAFEAWLQTHRIDSEFTLVSAGRKLAGESPDDAGLLVRALLGGLLPLRTGSYPHAHFV